MAQEQFTAEQMAVVDAMVERRAAEIAEQTVSRLWTGQANLAMITPSDLTYRGKGVYYSPSGGWFCKGPGGALLELPGPPNV